MLAAVVALVSAELGYTGCGVEMEAAMVGLILMQSAVCYLYL